MADVLLPASPTKMAETDEQKCLLTPVSTSNFAFVKESESVASLASDTSPTPVPPLYANCPLIYSEPAIAFSSTIDEEDRSVAMPRLTGISDTALPMIYKGVGADSGVSSMKGRASDEESRRGSAPVGRSAISVLNGSEQSCLASCSNVRHAGHKTSFSTREIREQHALIQNKYRKTVERRRNYTDPVDFEGILNIIGGCSWWQIWVYFFISLQQIPHAMFNLNVVYMMYQPDHWCTVPGFNVTSSAANATLWSLEESLDTGVVFPRIENRQRNRDDFHDQCHYYDRGMDRYAVLRQMSLEEATETVKRWKETEGTPTIVKCQKWQYKNDVMRETIVNEWDLVCDDNFKRAHAHLFYSFGFLVGCQLGGLASDSFGRKPTILFFGVLSSFFGLFLPFSTYFPMFLLVRFLGAVCNEAADLAAYVLCMEITGTRYRAMVGSLLQAPWAVGYALIALLAYFVKSWKTIQIITGVLHLLSMFVVGLLPESPRWLIVNNRSAEAEEIIRSACRPPPFPFNLCKMHKGSLPCDLELIKHAETKKFEDEKKRITFFSMLRSRPLAYRSALVCVVWIATALVYYGLIIALSDQSAPGRVLFSGNFFVNNAIAGAIELPTLIACVYLMQFGRKRAQRGTLMMAGISIIAGIVAMSQYYYMTALAALMAGKIFIQGSFNILYIFTSELFPTVVRNSAVGFFSMVARFGSGVSSYIAILSDVTLPMFPNLIFAIFSLAAAALVGFLPETMDLPLPETLQDAVTFLTGERRHPKPAFAFGLEKHEESCEGEELTSAQTTTTSAPKSEPANSKEDMDSRKSSTPVLSTRSSARQRHPAGNSPGRQPPSINLSREASRADSILQELADLQLPDKLPEPFSDDA